MDFTMIDGCVFGIIGGITFPLTTLPMDQWREGTDVVDHPALRRWELDCNRKYITETNIFSGRDASDLYQTRTLVSYLQREWTSIAPSSFYLRILFDYNIGDLFLPDEGVDATIWTK